MGTKKMREVQTAERHGVSVTFVFERLDQRPLFEKEKRKRKKKVIYIRESESG
jgi:hypothetical protein